MNAEQMEDLNQTRIRNECAALGVSPSRIEAVLDFVLAEKRRSFQFGYNKANEHSTRDAQQGEMALL